MRVSAVTCCRGRNRHYRQCWRFRLRRVTRIAACLLAQTRAGARIEGTVKLSEKPGVVIRIAVHSGREVVAKRWQLIRCIRGSRGVVLCRTRTTVGGCIVLKGWRKGGVAVDNGLGNN
jgi:hypothetical protein